METKCIDYFFTCYMIPGCEIGTDERPYEPTVKELYNEDPKTAKLLMNELINFKEDLLSYVLEHHKFSTVLENIDNLLDELKNIVKEK